MSEIMITSQNNPESIIYKSLDGCAVSTPIGRARHGLWFIPDLTIFSAYTKMASLMNITFLSNPTEQKHKEAQKNGKRLWVPKIALQCWFKYSKSLAECKTEQTK